MLLIFHSLPTRKWITSYVSVIIYLIAYSSSFSPWRHSQAEQHQLPPTATISVAPIVTQKHSVTPVGQPNHSMVATAPVVVSLNIIRYLCNNATPIKRSGANEFYGSKERLNALSAIVTVQTMVELRRFPYSVINSSVHLSVSLQASMASALQT